MTAPVRWCSSWNASTTDPFPHRKKDCLQKQTVLFWYHLKSQPETVPQFPFSFSGEEEPRLFQQPPGRVVLRSDQSGHPGDLQRPGQFQHGPYRLGPFPAWLWLSL